MLRNLYLPEASVLALLRPRLDHVVPKLVLLVPDRGAQDPGHLPQERGGGVAERRHVHQEDDPERTVGHGRVLARGAVAAVVATLAVVAPKVAVSVRVVHLAVVLVDRAAEVTKEQLHLLIQTINKRLISSTSTL